MNDKIEQIFQEANRLVREIGDLKHEVYAIKSSAHTDETKLNALRDALLNVKDSLAVKIEAVDVILAQVQRHEYAA